MLTLYIKEQGNPFCYESPIHLFPRLRRPLTAMGLLRCSTLKHRTRYFFYRLVKSASPPPLHRGELLALARRNASISVEYISAKLKTQHNPCLRNVRRVVAPYSGKHFVLLFLRAPRLALMSPALKVMR